MLRVHIPLILNIRNLIHCFKINRNKHALTCLPHPKHPTSTEEAIRLLKNGQPLTNLVVEGELRLETEETWDQELVFEHCTIAYFSASAVSFGQLVRFTNCHFKNCQFVFTYFLGGLIIEHCTFDSYLDFQCGGHNKKGNPVMIANNHFRGFVNFFDCWYESEVIVRNNTFHQGTNILGQPQNLSVTFEQEPIIKDNIGQVDLKHEGEKQTPR